MMKTHPYISIEKKGHIISAELNANTQSSGKDLNAIGADCFYGIYVLKADFRRKSQIYLTYGGINYGSYG